MDNVLIRKLTAFAPLPAADVSYLKDLTRTTRLIRARQDLRREGERARSVLLVVDGFACRYKLSDAGRRHIVGYLVPGDLCDQHAVVLKTMDHGIVTLCDTRVVEIPHVRILEMADRPALAKALWWMALVDEATLREWLVNLGQRKAVKRVAHLFCEFYHRLHLVGLASDTRFDLPLTQSDLADTMGLSTVHMNRALQSLRSQGLVTFSSRRAEIRDVARLQAMCGFDGAYLHIENLHGQAIQEQDATPHPAQAPSLDFA